ncbi:MAG: amidohydrolase family protein, partial [Candidatus Aminicenantes bacterium]|nr:amidohydrolase family protein [Candidatus Aminicenantes bacterium]
FLEPYSDYPGYCGEPRQTEDEIAKSAIELLKIGFNMRIHCIGDAANRTAINAYERALEATGADGKDARFALEHCQVLSPDDISRLAELGIVASMQPLHATEDMHFAESRLGPERIKYAYIWSDLLDLGVVVATGTDYSVSPYNPFYTLHAAVTRQDRDNNPPGGWFPEQAMTREEAIQAATMGGAYVMFAENILGSIEVGKLADFVVIPVDYMTIPAEDIWKIKPDMTVIGGEVVYTKPVQAQK